MRSLKDRPFHTKVDKWVSMTEQAHAGETDINTIMAKAIRGEHSDYIKNHEGTYGIATRENYFEANIMVATANSMFEELPAKLRSRFKHDPGLFLEYVQDPKNLEEMVELKLAKAPPPPEKTSSTEEPSTTTTTPPETTPPPE